MADTPEQEPQRFAAPDALSASAREWHKLQLAALAFVGLCGVLTGDSGTRLPIWLQSVAGILALLALAVAAIGLFLVAVVAWPLGAPADPAAGARRLRAGVILTCVAVGLTALSASSNWWPQSGAERPVQVTTSSGTACGQVVDSAAGWIDLDVRGTVVRVDLVDLVSLQPTDSC
ncbi:hypothetical protein DDE18_21035 [Nocardioides gansuensis]|uniref:Uncharacterized protein n=1 Tax=Nocardioides gansuensis TaxID=2138300 RepID=A0A2T8F595_9ACTN|nr:hypothetical protein [Nocardioides gansuensis]PVG80869.1 hypothetical protein DDE18_21035 [Nocardioides gansuensis]